jgi:NAD(P)-dependent dehydrogenase (short-subunit alcohol dehydrogenase family)
MRILVTGANRGLGLALAQTGAERGHHIVAGVRDVRQGEDKLSDFEFSKSISIVPLDVTNEDSVKRAANFVKDFSTEMTYSKTDFSSLISKTRKSVTSGFPFVMVPVLSSKIALTLCVSSRYSPPLNKTPFFAPFPVPTIIDVGVARPLCKL